MNRGAGNAGSEGKGKYKGNLMDRTISLRLLKVGHFALTVALFAVAWWLFRFHGDIPLNRIGIRYDYYAVIMYGLILLFFNKTYNTYLLGYTRSLRLVVAQAISQFFSVVIIYFLVSFAWWQWHNPAVFFVLFAVQVAIDIGWTKYANDYYRRVNAPRETILIYRNKLDRKRISAVMGRNYEAVFRISKELMYDGSFRDLEKELAGFGAIIVAGVNSRCRNGILKYCQEHRVTGYFLPHIGDVIMQGARHIQSFDLPLLTVNRKYLLPEYVAVKRLFDFSSSFAALVVLSPVLLLTAVCIKAYDGGDVLYRQTRLTKDGRQFQIYKFRSMRMDAEKDGVARLSTGDKDDRITPIGRLIRKTRIDELPQLFNILKGDMSIVGPRPERPEIAEQYEQTMPDFKLRLQVKAGLTGYAQIYGKYNTGPYEKLEFDLLYINQMSILTDLELIFATIPILLDGESTEGIKEGKVSALEIE